MTNEEVAESVTAKLALSAAWADLERLRLIDVEFEENLGDLNDTILRIASDKKEIKARRYDNFKLILAISLQIDKLQGQVAPVAAPIQTTEAPKKERGKKVAATPETVTTAPAEKHPCTVCGDTFYNKTDLVKHLRVEHKVSLEEAVKPAPTLVCANSLCIQHAPGECLSCEGVVMVDSKRTLSLCANCVGSCNDLLDPPVSHLRSCHQFTEELSADQVAWRNSTCEEWRGCPFQAKCFGPANEENPDCFKEVEIRKRGEASLAAETKAAHTPVGQVAPVCWNRTCAWSDLAKADNCDADNQFRAGRPVAECKCFITGADPVDGQDAAACFNTDCPSNDPELPNCCEEWAEVWECPRVVSAGWGAAAEEEAEPVDTYREQREAIIRAAKAAGDDINDHGVYLNPEIINIPLPPKLKYSAEIKIATNADSGFLYGYDFRRKDGGNSGAPSVSGTVYPSRTAAIGAAIIHLKKTWPEAWTEAKLKAVRNAVADFVASLDAPVKEPVKKADVAQAERIAEYFADSSTPTPSNEPAKQEVAQPVGESPAQASEVVQTFAPLDGPFNNCELCHGYGVIEAELYGEPTLVPCTCEAGEKVREESSSLPDLEALPKCFNGACTANDPGAKVVCLRIDQPGREGKLCHNFAEKCTHHMLKRTTQPDGSVTCDVCGFLLRPAAPSAACANKQCASNVPTRDGCGLGADDRFGKPVEKCSDYKPANLANTEPAKPEPTALQLKCPHPKPFREVTAAGEVCKVCKLVLSGGGQPGLFAV